MSAIILDGKEVAKKVRAQVRREARVFAEQTGHTPPSSYSVPHFPQNGISTSSLIQFSISSFGVNIFFHPIFIVLFTPFTVNI